MGKTALRTLAGTVKSYNFSPKGHYEGLLLETTGGVVQVNLPKEWAAEVAAGLSVGTTAELHVQDFEDDRPAAHPVYMLEELPAQAAGSHSNGSAAGRKSVTGQVVRLNFARHGEVNGAVLDSGDFVHTKPHGAKQVNFSVGQTVTALGDTKPSASGHLVVEAGEVNGIMISQDPKAKKKAAAKKKPGKNG